MPGKYMFLFSWYQLLVVDVEQVIAYDFQQPRCLWFEMPCHSYRGYPAKWALPALLAGYHRHDVNVLHGDDITDDPLDYQKNIKKILTNCMTLINHIFKSDMNLMMIQTHLSQNISMKILEFWVNLCLSIESYKMVNNNQSVLWLGT